MKKILLGALVGVALLVSSSSAFAADPLEVAPNMYKKLFENDEVRVMQVTFKPGEKIAEHSHPDHYVYAASAGTLRIHKPGQKASDVSLNVGDVVWIPAETHWAENIGKTQVTLVVNELKHPGKPGTVH